MDADAVWTIVDAALAGIMIKPLFIIWVLGFCLARRRSDHARVAFTWLKIVFPFEILCASSLPTPLFLPSAADLSQYSPPPRRQRRGLH